MEVIESVIREGRKGTTSQENLRGCEENITIHDGPARSLPCNFNPKMLWSAWKDRSGINPISLH